MNVDSTRIVMTETRCRSLRSPDHQVYHRDFAMMRVEGRSAEDAAGYLVNRLGAALGDTVDPSHREEVRSALADARAFLDGCVVWSRPPSMMTVGARRRPSLPRWGTPCPSRAWIPTP